MNDPYQILGVSRNASEDEIKKAYRALCRKYHPDLHTGEADIDMYETKFREVQAAYNQIMDERQGKSAYTGGMGGYSTSGTDGDSMHKTAAVNFINNRRFAEAMNVLNSITKRDAEWYYIAACAQTGLRNNALALQYARTAVNMNPSNLQYQMLLRQLEGASVQYTEMHRPYEQSDGMSECIRCCAWNLACNICLSVCCNCGG